MKIQVDPTMESKIKFSDRLKELLNNESHQDVDPYVFSEPEPMLSGQKSFDSKSKNNQATARGKCVKRKHKDQVNIDNPISDSDLSDVVSCNINNKNNVEFSTSNPMRCSKSDDVERRESRDHTLLYYPQAGQELSDSDSSGDELSVYQRHWFPGEVSGPRSARLSQLRSQLRRRLIQLHKGGHESERLLRDRTKKLLEAATINQLPERLKSSAIPLLTGGPCGVEGCRQLSLPSTRHCSQHIMLSSNQLLFEHCTAKFSDNTQCCVPVFDIIHELPLCPEHARKRDNYNRKAQETKPKKTRKKSTSPIIPRPKSNNKSRPKKRKRPPTIKPLEDKILDNPTFDDHYENNQVIQNIDSLQNKTLNNINTTIQQSSSNNPNLNTLGLGLGSLGLGTGLKVELGDHEVFAALDPTEHDFGNVLNNLPADAFNDLFIESRNGEYEPSREEEEELERALEAVDKDVRNLERMGQTHGLLEPALLAQLMSDIAS